MSDDRRERGGGDHQVAVNDANLHAIVGELATAVAQQQQVTRQILDQVAVIQQAQLSLMESVKVLSEAVATLAHKSDQPGH